MVKNFESYSQLVFMSIYYLEAPTLNKLLNDKNDENTNTTLQNHRERSRAKTGN